MKLIDNNKELYKLYDLIEKLTKQLKSVKKRYLELNKELYLIDNVILLNNKPIIAYQSVYEAIDISNSIFWKGVE